MKAILLLGLLFSFNAQAQEDALVKLTFGSPSSEAERAHYLPEGKLWTVISIDKDCIFVIDKPGLPSSYVSEYNGDGKHFKFIVGDVSNDPLLVVGVLPIGIGGPADIYLHCETGRFTTVLSSE